MPDDIRQSINRMLDEGLPYHTILERLGQAGKHLNIQNLCNWKYGGYQDHRLRHARAVILHAALHNETDAEPAKTDTKP